MNQTVVRILLIITLTVLSSTSVFAAVLHQDEIKSVIEKKVYTEISNHISGELEVGVKTVPFRKIVIPDGELRIDVQINDNSFSARKMVMVLVQVNGKKIKKFGVPVSLKIYKNVWVATKNIQRGKLLSTSNIRLEKKEVTKNFENILTEDKEISDSIASRNIRSGQIVDKRYIISKPDVMKNSMVSVIFKTNALKIAIDAKAMQNASIGDYVKVKSEKFEKCYTGVVISPNKVLVEI